MILRSLAPLTVILAFLQTNDIFGPQREQRSNSISVAVHSDMSMVTDDAVLEFLFLGVLEYLVFGICTSYTLHVAVLKLSNSD